MNRISIITCAVAALTAQSAFGQTVWTNAAGGSANLSSNWSANVPTSGSTVRFDLPGPYTVTFAAPVQASTVDVNTGQVTLDLDRQTFAVGGSINIGPSTTTFPPVTAAAIVVQDGRLTTSSTLSVGRTNVMGTLTIRDGGIVEASSLRLEANSFTSVTGAGSVLSFGSHQFATNGTAPGSQLVVADGGVAMNTSTSSNSGAAGNLLVRGAGSRVRNVMGLTTRVEAGASADYTTLSVSDFTADHAMVSTVDLSVGAATGGPAFPARLTLRASTLSAGGSSNMPLRVYGGATLELDDGLIQTGRAIANDGIIRGSGRSTGTLENGPTGTVTVGAGQRLSFEGRATSQNNRGLINVIGGELWFANAVMNTPISSSTPGGRVVGRDATLRFGDGSPLTAMTQGTGGTLTLTGGVNDVFGYINNGSLARIIHTGDSQTIYYDKVVNTGTVQTAAGSRATFLGDVTGPGTFTGPGAVTFEGNVAPGASPALVTFGGDVRFAEGSRLVLEIGGTERGTGYDAIEVAGSLDLDGTVAITTLNGFVPLPGQQFEFLTAESITGAPLIVNETGFAGLQFNDTLAADGLTLEAAATPGDANLDASVNFADLVALAQHYNEEGQSWLGGDFDGDTIVGFADLVSLAQNYGKTPAAFAADWARAQALVPEPTLIAMPLLLAAAAARRHRRG